jgi:tellurite methyltransferase
MSTYDGQRWDEKYAAKVPVQELAPDGWLTEQLAASKPGRALELACGLGHNAVWLAQQGWQIDAVDISAVGLSRAKDLADVCCVNVNWIATDLEEFIPAADDYDLAVVIRFLDRLRLPALIQEALRPGGLLIYETFTTAHLARPSSRMKNPAFALERGELPRLFPQFEVVSYAECSLADRDVARLVCKKR